MGSPMWAKAACHPERKHSALGLCQECYTQQSWLKRAARRREEYYQKHYGISSETADALRKSQKHCYVCGKTGGRFGKLHIDHDHKTGRIRGLLCFKCNSFVGLLEARYNYLSRIFRYLNLNIDVPYVE